MATSNATLTINTFDISKITFGKPAKNTYGLNTIAVLYDGTPRWGLQLPKLRVPYAPSAPMRKEGEPAPPPEKLVNYGLDLSLSGYKETEKSALVDTVKRFYDILVALNERCIAEMASNPEQWIDMERDMVSTKLCQKFFRSHIKEPTDKDPKKQEEKRKKYAPTFRAKMGVKEGLVQCDVFNATTMDKVKPVDDASALLRGSDSQAIVQCAGLVQADGKWGFNWRIHKIKVWPASGTSGFDFQDEDEGETLEADFVEEKPSAAAPAAAAAPTNQVSDEDDEEDELDAPAPAPVRQPEPPKEVTIKKAVRKAK
jgi:hypothetical protein